MARRRPSGERRLARRRRRITFWIVWWALLSALYVLLVFKTEPAEVVAAVVCGALGATGAELVRTYGSVRFLMPGWGWLRAVASLPRHVVADTWRLTVVLWRVVVRREQVRGRFLTLPFRDADGRSPEAAARRAIAQVVASTSPNSLVVGFADDEELVLVHQLVETREPPAVDPWEYGW